MTGISIRQSDERTIFDMGHVGYAVSIFVYAQNVENEVQDPCVINLVLQEVHYYPLHCDLVLVISP